MPAKGNTRQKMNEHKSSHARMHFLFFFPFLCKETMMWQFTSNNHPLWSAKGDSAMALEPFVYPIAEYDKSAQVRVTHKKVKPSCSNPKYISQFSKKELELSSQKTCMFDHHHQLCIQPLIDIQNIYSNFIFICILNDLLRKNSFPWSLSKKIMSFYHRILGFSINKEIYSQLNVTQIL